MHKSELSVLLIILAFGILSIVNIFLHVIPYSAPPVLLVLFVAGYSIWEHKYGNKA